MSRLEASERACSSVFHIDDPRSRYVSDSHSPIAYLSVCACWMIYSVFLLVDICPSVSHYVSTIWAQCPVP